MKEPSNSVLLQLNFIFPLSFEPGVLRNYNIDRLAASWNVVNVMNCLFSVLCVIYLSWSRNSLSEYANVILNL